ncbi:cilia- and flagella-associated protein 57 [Nematostella vectensis]|uniref:cilia- and flagella-associated protein 57 n=1 Tax=Nematostella vectensis TaxID=45351 RepID=UPI0020771D08|nr:cilia- and flagella-associated protein 57 [Nematostella vectensis]
MTSSVAYRPRSVRMRVMLALVVILALGDVLPVQTFTVTCKRCLKVLNSDIKNAARKSMDAVVQAGAGLTRIRDEFVAEQKSLNENLQKATKMINAIDKQIKQKTKEIKEIFDDAKKKAEQKLKDIEEASSALGAIEDEVGARATEKKAKGVREHIAAHPGHESQQEKEILDENGLITTVDAARIIAKSKAEQAEQETVRREKVVENDAKELQKNMDEEEQELKTEEEKELDDEKQARDKIQEAIKHNSEAMNKARKFLQDIEEGIEKFHQDIEKSNVQ